MDDYQLFKTVILGMAGLLVLAILTGFALSQRQWFGKNGLVSNLNCFPPKQIRAWCSERECDSLDHGRYTEEVLHTYVSPSGPTQTFVDGQIETAAEALIKAGVPIANPSARVVRVQARLSPTRGRYKSP